MNAEKNSVKWLKTMEFSRLPLEEKVNIKMLGRATPTLNILQETQSRGRSYNRTFHPRVYKQHQWLTGCPEENAFFCFPCLLFANADTDDSNQWIEQGVNDLKHLNEKTKKHENCQKHLRNVASLALLATTHIKTHSSGAYLHSLNKHNEYIKKNREILSKVIDCAVFCGQFELPMREHDDLEQSTNPDVFRGLLDFAGKLDDNLRTHFLTSVFKGSSKTIQNEILDCILSVCRDEISKEVKNAKFLAVMAEDTADVSEHTQQVIVFRYELSGVIYERFWGFFNPESQNAEGLAKCISEQLNKVLDDDEHEKLIAQTYDDAAVMSGERGGVQEIIKQSYRNAHFVHCYAHELDLIMQKAASQNLQARIFFCSLAGIFAYFEKSPLRLSALDDISKQTPGGSNTRWNFNSSCCTGVLSTVFENKEVLKECFEYLQDNTNVATVQGATGLLHTLNDENFNFWLIFFYEIMPHVDDLYCKLQSCNANSISICKAVEDFTRIIEEERTNLDSMLHEEPPSAKRRRFSKQSNNVAAKEVCDYIISQAKDRFCFTKHLSAANLFSPCISQSSTNQYPTAEQIQETADAYPYLNKERLETELHVLYEMTEFNNLSGHKQIYDMLYATGIFETFAETFQLLQIILTTPMAEPERCCSALKSIKTFLRNTMVQNRLTAIAMLNIEKDLISKIINFNDKVIEKFGEQKERRMEFRFK